ncbi:MAG: hypothetical protein ACKOW8_03015 [Flavobacteriales bacterium]
MKKLLFGIFILTGVTSFSQKVAPSERVLQAFNSTEIAAMQQSEIARLNLRGEKLCWFEDVKPSLSEPVFQLVSRGGKKVSLHSKDLKSFNPLMYQLPQSKIACENLLIETTDGVQKLLVVRSEDMMQKEMERTAK